MTAGRTKYTPEDEMNFYENSISQIDIFAFQVNEHGSLQWDESVSLQLLAFYTYAGVCIVYELNTLCCNCWKRLPATLQWGKIIISTNICWSAPRLWNFISYRTIAVLLFMQILNDKFSCLSMLEHKKKLLNEYFPLFTFKLVNFLTIEDLRNMIDMKLNWEYVENALNMSAAPLTIYSPHFLIAQLINHLN